MPNPNWKSSYCRYMMCPLCDGDHKCIHVFQPLFDKRTRLYLQRDALDKQIKDIDECIVDMIKNNSRPF